MGTEHRSVPRSHELGRGEEAIAMRDPLLTIKDVQEATKLSRTKVYELLRTEIPTITIGTAVRVRPEALEAWLKSKEEPAAVPSSTSGAICPTCGRTIDPAPRGRVQSLQQQTARNTH